MGMEAICYARDWSTRAAHNDSIICICNKIGVSWDWVLGSTESDAGVGGGEAIGGVDLMLGPMELKMVSVVGVRAGEGLFGGPFGLLLGPVELRVQLQNGRWAHTLY